MPAAGGSRDTPPARRDARVGASEGMEDEEARREEIARLKEEHRDLDTAIEALAKVPGGDLLQLQRLKKRKLVLKDRISFLEDQLTPDIIA